MSSDGDVAVVNITNTQAAGRGWGALRSSFEPPVFSRPAFSQYSSVNFAANTPPNPNLALVDVDERPGPQDSPFDFTSEFCYDGAVASHHVILDLVGHIRAANVDATTPRRLLDTRNEEPKIGATTTTTNIGPTLPLTVPASQPQDCDPSYPTVCIPPPPPDLDCGDIPFRDFVVLQPDPHNFDGNNDGIGCVS